MKALAATKSLPALQALRALPALEPELALYAEQIAQIIPGVQLAIIDMADVVEYPYDQERIRGLLDEAIQRRGLPVASSAEFLANPDEWVQRARHCRQDNQILDRLTVGFVAYSGGVGRTTLALDTALHFARRTGRPALLLEFVYGASALVALTGREMPFLYDLVSRVDLEPAILDGVTLIPMDYENCRLFSAEEFGKSFEKQMAKHALTVIDAVWPHSLLRSVQDQVDRWLVIAAPRPDAVENATRLATDLGSRAAIVLNQKRGLADSLALAGKARELELPHLDRPDRRDGRLGRLILEYLYGSAWREYEKPESVLAALGRHLGRRRPPGQPQARAEDAGA